MIVECGVFMATFSTGFSKMQANKWFQVLQSVLFSESSIHDEMLWSYPNRFCYFHCYTWHRNAIHIRSFVNLIDLPLGFVDMDTLNSYCFQTFILMWNAFLFAVGIMFGVFVDCIDSDADFHYIRYCTEHLFNANTPISNCFCRFSHGRVRLFDVFAFVFFFLWCQSKCTHDVYNWISAECRI